MIGSIRHNQAYLALHQGEDARAEALLVESLVVSRALEEWNQIAYGLAVMGGAARGRPERAARLLGTAAAWFDARGTLIGQTERADHDGSIAARVQLGDEVFAAAWTAGQEGNNLLWEGLSYYAIFADKDIPWLADRMEYTKSDFTELTIKLNTQATWSDGVPLTSKDVVFTFEGQMKHDILP